jgi:hypothetical protein
MGKLTATLETAQGFSILAKDTYPAHIDQVTTKIRESFTSDFRDMVDGDEQHIARYLGDRGAIMLSVQWKPEGDKAPDFVGSIFDNVMVAGVSGPKSKHPGEPLSTQRLCDYVNALGVSWTCGNCGVESTHKFVIDKGKYFCPGCGKPASFDFDTATWQGKRASIQVDIGKDNKNEDRNEVGKVRALA